jgi:hypothetical protein
MRSASYSMERRTHVTWKEDNVERMESHSTRHSQKWMKKTEQPDMNEEIKNQESFTFLKHTRAPVGEVMYIREVTYRKVTYICELSMEQPRTCGKILKKKECTDELQHGLMV